MPYATTEVATRAIVDATPSARLAPLMGRALPIAAPAARAGDRVELVEQLTRSRVRLRELVARLPREAWTASATPGGWTACEVLEHLALTEWAVVEFVRGLLAAPPVGAGAAQAVRDADVMRAAADRSCPRQAPERLRPTGSWVRPGSWAARVDAARGVALVLAGDVPALRRRVGPHPHLGALDGAQWLLFLAGHTDRHVVQLTAIADAWRTAPAAA